MNDRRVKHEDFMRERRAGYDRRLHDRRPVTITIELTAGKDLYFHVSGNISVGGAFFDRAIPHPVGTPVRVALQLPNDDGPPIRCNAEVVNIPEDGGGLGMGVRFLDLSQIDIERIESFLHEIEATGGRG